MNRRILAIGIGTGHPDYITVQAVAALNRTDVFFIPDKRAETGELGRIRRDICERFIRDRDYRMVTYAVPERQRQADYAASVEAWHEQLGQLFERLIADELGEDRCGAFLVWGDPAFYDSTTRILDRLRKKPGLVLDYEIIPGISAPQALAARHGISLTRPGESLLFASGRALAQGFPGHLDRIVVMLDVPAALASADPDSLIHWGANLGTPDEALVSGRLGEVIDEIARIRAATKAKAGWIMETCLLSRAETS